MKGAVIYARYSSERQNEQSIDGQLTVCHKFAEDNGLTILDTYIDRAMTGTNDNRAAFQQMLSDAEKPVAWDIVLVYALDRFGRDSIEISVNKYRLRKANKMLISATQRTSLNIDGTKNLDGIILENFYIGLAEYYSAELSQKIKRGLQENRKKGLCTSGNLPYGYKSVNKKAVIDENEAEVVRYIFDQYYAGKVAPQIIEDLKSKGITYRGKPFYKSILYYILRQEKYIGIARYGDDIYDNIFPAIIDKNIFDKIQVVLAKNKIGSRSTEVEFLLKGKLFCGHCGCSMQGNSGTSQCGKISYYYTCMGRKNRKGCRKSNVRKDDLERLVIDTTISLLSENNMLNEIADKVLELHNLKEQENSFIVMLNQQRADAKKALNNIMKAIEAGIINETTKDRMNELENQIHSLDEKIKLEEFREKTKLTKVDILKYLSEAIKQEPRMIINTLIQKIELYDDKMIIYYNYIDKNKNPNDNSDFYLSHQCSDRNSMVEATGLEPVTSRM